jgi:four helix bundle suffix protein
MKSKPSDGNDEKNGNNESHSAYQSHSSHRSHASHVTPKSAGNRQVIPPRGDYQTLLSCQKAEAIFDLTFRFAHKFLSKGDRTVDQMIQSARSGKQNILLDQQLKTLEKEFLEKGGLRERMTKARLDYRNQRPK